MNYEMVIGLEIHVQLATQSKLFSGASINFGAEPNTQACHIDLGMPGVLPVFNQKALEMAVKFGLAVNAQIDPLSVFARKNYFYPDLPKGYQISQMDKPVVGKGAVNILDENGNEKIIRVTRAHLEEDAGKSLHKAFNEDTGIDLNRAGTPLIEIVSEPDIRSTFEAVAYAKKIRNLVRYLEISDGNMQEGSFRMDVNISLRPFGQNKFGTRAEIKNLNSFRFMEQAIHYEYHRQADILSDGNSVVQETRLYDIDKGETRSMRSKEEANDYRYFPDPDLLPVVLDEDFIAQIKSSLPELPEQKKARFEKSFGLSSAQAEQLTARLNWADFFETAQKFVPKHTDILVNWMLGELSAALNKNQIDINQSPISAVDFGQLLAAIADGTISGKIAKTVFEDMWQTGEKPTNIIASKGLQQITDTNVVAKMIDDVIAANPVQVGQFKAGKTKVLGFFVGQIMQLSKGKANPKEINKLLQQKLS